MSDIVDEGDILTVDSSPSEKLTALAFTILNQAIETPELAKQLEPYECYVLVVDNDNRETGRSSQCFNPPEGSGLDPTFYHLARSMMLQARDIAAVAKLSPDLHKVALEMTAELLSVLTARLRR